MLVAENKHQSTFQKFRRDLEKINSHPAAQRVHKFRTGARRVEVLISELSPDSDRKHKKLLRLLAKLRRRAGRVRDLDVQITALRNLKIPEAASRKRQMLRTLMEERTAQEKRLAMAFSKDCRRELRKRLKRATDFELSPDLALKRAHALLAALPAQRSVVNEALLHQYRTLGKRARYLAEVAVPAPEARLLVAELKRVQEAIGDWHDWWKLANRAEEIFTNTQRSVLVAALSNVTKAKFRQAVDTLLQVRTALSAPPATERKSPATPETSANAAAA